MGMGYIVQNVLGRLEGELSRQSIANGAIESFVNGDSVDIEFGRVVCFDSSNEGKVKLPAASTDVVAGLTVRNVVQADSDGDVKHFVDTPGPVLKEGYMFVKCVHGTPAPGGTVYFRYAEEDTPDPDRPIGSIETEAISTKVIALPNAIFNGKMDGDKLVEIRINLAA